MSYDSNPYYSPEAMGVEVFGSFERSEPNYSFDTVLVNRDPETGLFYVNQDSGCSCPMPFEDFNNKYDLGEPLNARQALQKIGRLIESNQYAYVESMSLREKLRKLVN